MTVAFADMLPKIANAISGCQQADAADLKEFDFGERVLTCRLGFFLAQCVETDETFKQLGIKVDCEYNRNKASAKRVGKQSREQVTRLLLKVGEHLTNKTKVPLEELERRAAKVVEAGGSLEAHLLEEFVENVASWGNLAGALVYPDIVIHKRGTHEFNLLVIEAKKYDADRADIDHDFEKLRYYTISEENADTEAKPGLNYKFGLYLQFGQDGILVDAKIFEGGECTRSVLEDFAAHSVKVK